MTTVTIINRRFHPVKGLFRDGGQGVSEMEESWKNLQPLRIPPGWVCIWNKLESAEPADVPEGDSAWLFTYVQDMTYFRREGKEYTISIDLGWYPDGDPNGAYRLEAILDDDWTHPLLSFTSRSTKEIVETMEFWMFSRIPRYGPVNWKWFRKKYGPKEDA